VGCTLGVFVDIFYIPPVSGTRQAEVIGGWFQTWPCRYHEPPTVSLAYSPPRTPTHARAIGAGSQQFFMMHAEWSMPPPPSFLLQPSASFKSIPYCRLKCLRRALYGTPAQEGLENVKAVQRTVPGALGMLWLAAVLLHLEAMGGSCALGLIRPR